MTDLIFVVEGEYGAGRLARSSLEQSGYLVHTFSTATAVIEEAQENIPSLIVVASAFPDGGVDLCRRVRKDQFLAKTPLILLIAAGDEQNRTTGLEAGADDCVVRSLSPRELVARVQSLLRRLGRPRSLAPADAIEIVIDRAAMKLSVRGNDVTTTTLEFRLVDYLARHRGQVFTRDVLLDAVWGETQFVTPRSVDACIRRIRGKIEPDRSSPTYLKTIRGVGYRFDAIAAWPSSNESCTCTACTPSSVRPRTSPAAFPKRRRAAC